MVNSCVRTAVMLEQETWIELLAHDITEKAMKCWNCNFCYSACPLYKSMRGFMINGPSGLIQSIYYALNLDLITKEFTEDLINILYSCTTCNSCVLTCKDYSLGVPIVDIIECGRKFLLERSIGPANAHKAVLGHLTKCGNPYGKPASKRFDWLKQWEKGNQLSYKTLPSDWGAELLLFVGCTASYEEELQNVARSVVLLHEKMKIDYGFLKEESCCGSPARQLGDEGLFAELSEKTKDAILKSRVQQVVTLSPHCYNSFKTEYPVPFKKLEVQHYTEYLSNLMKKGILSPTKKIYNTITYHDPCYLGKRNEIYDAPRTILSKIPGLNLVEMKSNKRDSLCCGGGGGRMYIEVDEVKRLSHLRLEEALATGAEIIATACPWCYIQMKDAIKATDQEGRIEVRDVAEILIRSVV
jgi:Fe-S oxidoreductase